MRKTEITADTSLKLKNAPNLTSSAAVATAAAGTLGFGASFVDVNRASPELRSIQPRDGLVPFFGICHFHKAKPARTSRVPISENTHSVDVPVGFEDLAELIFRRVEAEVPNENVLQGALVSVIANRVEHPSK